MYDATVTSRTPSRLLAVAPGPGWPFSRRSPSEPRTKGRRLQRAVACAIALFAFSLDGTAFADSYYQVGKIQNVTFLYDTVLIRLDTGIPDNCNGTSSGWLAIPAAHRPMQSWVIALWVRGDL